MNNRRSRIIPGIGIRQLVVSLIIPGTSLAFRIWSAIVRLKDRLLPNMSSNRHLNRRCGGGGGERIDQQAMPTAGNMSTQTFKPASHRTSLSLPDKLDKGGVIIPRGLQARSNGTYSDLPEEIRQSIKPLRKPFPVTPEQLRDKDEDIQANTEHCLPTDIMRHRHPSIDSGMWKMKADAYKAKLDAAKLRWESKTMINEHDHDDDDDRPNEAIGSDDDSDMKRLTASKRFVTIDRDEDSVVMLRSGDPFSTMHKLSKLIDRLKECYQNLESDLRSGDEIQDLYIDDDEVMLTSDLNSHFLDGYYFGSRWPSALSLPPLVVDIGEYEPYAIIAGVDSRTGKMTISVPAEPYHSSSIQVCANHEGVCGQHLVTVKYRHLQTGSERIPFERVICSPCVVGVIRVRND